MADMMTLTLERDGHDQPWGFRLQGGYDVGVPLSIQRVLVGTPVDGILKKDDIILKIGKAETKKLSHQRAVDLFTDTGNQIEVILKRSPKSAQPYGPPHSTGTPSAGGHTTTTRTTDTRMLNSITKTRFTAKAPTTGGPHSGSALDSLSIQNQPYRTSPLIQPSVRVITDLDPGSASHLKKQAVHISAAVAPFENAYSPQPTIKSPDFSMQQKITTGVRNTSAKTFSAGAGWSPSKQVTGSLQQFQQAPSSSFSPQSIGSPLPQPDTHISFTPVAEAPIRHIPITPRPPTQVAPAMQHQQSVRGGGGGGGGGGGRQLYNSPIGLYSVENVAAVAKMNEMGLAPVDNTTTPRPLNPQKPQQVILHPPKDYNPQNSATWHALNESSEKPLIDFEKAMNYSSLQEHDPVYSDIYSAPKHPPPSPQPPADSCTPNTNCSPQVGRSPLHSPKPGKEPRRSPVADFLPPEMLSHFQQEDYSKDECHRRKEKDYTKRNF